MTFSEKIIQTLKKIPKGRVATYQQIAALAGKAQAPRVVVAVLKKHDGLPWQRVISKSGKIAFTPGSHNFKVQSALLKREGIAVAKNGLIDMRKFQWKRKPKLGKRTPRMFQDKI